MSSQKRGFLRNVGLAALGKTYLEPIPQIQAKEPGSYIGRVKSLPKVLVSSSRVIKETVGLRPNRRLGPRIELQELGNKKIIHNYGHGGSGWSLSWDSAVLANELIANTNEQKISIKGCGVMGLSAAITLQKKGYEVTTYTKNMYPYITSAVAMGNCSPSHKLIDPDKMVKDKFLTTLEKMMENLEG